MNTISRIRIVFAAVCLAVCMFFVLPPASGDEAPDAQDKEVLERIEEKMAEITTVQAGFTQEKELPVLERTMVIEGRMALQQPDHIAWHVDKPVRYRMVIRGSQLEQWDEDTDRVQKLNLDRNPAYRAMFQQLSAWFSGRYEKLLEQYTMRVESSEPVVLVFSPREEGDFAELISSVTITFREDESYIEKLEILEANESLSTIRFQGTELNGEIDDDTWKARP